MKRACCFTGHRPIKFEFGYDEQYETCTRLKIVLAREIKAMIDAGITTFYTGMALGADMWCAEIVLSFKRDLPELGIELIAVIPYEEQAAKWSAEYRKRYFNILDDVQEAILISQFYTPDCKVRRNRYMVDHSTHLIAVYNGSKGDTHNTLEYTKSKNIECVIINPDTLVPKVKKPFLTLIKGDKP